MTQTSFQTSSQTNSQTNYAEESLRASARLMAERMQIEGVTTDKIVLLSEVLACCRHMCDIGHAGNIPQRRTHE